MDDVVAQQERAFNPHDPDFVSDPYPYYAHMRSECPVLHTKQYGGFWLLTRYDDVKNAVVDWRTYTSSVPGVTAIPVIQRRSSPQLPIELDPPLHARYRALINPSFRTARIEELRPVVTRAATSLVDSLRARGRGDLVTDFCLPLSVETLAALLGLPPRDKDVWVGWVRKMFDVQDREEGSRATLELTAYVDQLITERRQELRGDFISQLIESEVEGHQLTDEEIRSIVMVQFGAGYETTADAMSVTLYYLSKHPEVRQRLADHADLIPTAIEEFLRYVSPIQIFGRNATRDIEIHGKTIPRDAVVALSFGSANHDPAVFSKPDECVLERSPNRHLAFGAGNHLCIGAPVARMEMAIMLEQFCQRVRDFHVPAGEKVLWRTRGDRRGIESLPIVLE